MRASVLGCLLLLLLSCNRGEPPAQQPLAELPGAKITVSPTSVAQTAPVARYAPDIYIPGLPSRVPTSVIFQFVQPVAPEEEIGASAGGGTVVRWSPEVEGRAYWRSPYMLEFVIARP